MKKRNLQLPYDPAIPLLGIYPEKMKTLTQKDTCVSMYTAVLFTTAKTWKQPKCPLADEWIMSMEHQSAIKMNAITSSAAT